MHPKLLERFKCESESENNGRKESWGTLSSSQHFGVKKGVLELQDGIKTIDKRVNYSYGLAQTKQQVG